VTDTALGVKSRKNTTVHGAEEAQSTVRSAFPCDDAVTLAPAGMAVENRTPRPLSHPIKVHALQDDKVNSTIGTSKTIAADTMGDRTADP
jgi:hypothetical protein